MKFKNVKEYVSSLLEHKSQSYEDTDFAERVLMNLVRKMSNFSKIPELKRALETKDSSSECIVIPRPKDCRIAISKSVGGTKKVYPQIIICQIFRWPFLIFHHDILSLSHCCNYGSPIKNATSVYICINPFHYEMSPEATTRLSKGQKKEMTSVSSSSASFSSFKKEIPSLVPIESSEDEEEMEENEKVNDNNDIFSTWENRAVSGSETPKSFESEFYVSDLDIKVFDSETETLLELESEMMDKLRVYDSIKHIVSGNYLKKSPEVLPNQEDVSIHDLLEDIRGSFERQFDENFDLTDPSGASDFHSVDENVHFHCRADESVYGDEDGKDVKIWTKDAMVAGSSLLDSWDLDPESNTSNTEFLTAGTISQEDFDNFFPGDSGAPSYRSSNNYESY